MKNDKPGIEAEWCDLHLRFELAPACLTTEELYECLYVLHKEREEKEETK